MKGLCPRPPRSITERSFDVCVAIVQAGSIREKPELRPPSGGESSTALLVLDHFVSFLGKLGSPRTTATFVSPPQRVWLRRALTRERAVLPYPVTTRRKHQLRHRRTRNRGCELDCGGGGRHRVHRLALPVSIACIGAAASIATSHVFCDLDAAPPHWPRF